MKRLLKSTFLSVFTAVITLSALPLSANATSDPNNDGIINISDSVYINAYLSGSFDVADLSALDFNSDCVISQIDVIACQRYCTGMDW